MGERKGKDHRAGIEEGLTMLWPTLTLRLKSIISRCGDTSIRQALGVSHALVEETADVEPVVAVLQSDGVHAAAAYPLADEIARDGDSRRLADPLRGLRGSAGDVLQPVRGHGGFAHGLRVDDPAALAADDQCSRVGLHVVMAVGAYAAERERVGAFAGCGNAIREPDHRVHVPTCRPGAAQIGHAGLHAGDETIPVTPEADGGGGLLDATAGGEFEVEHGEADGRGGERGMRVAIVIVEADSSHGDLVELVEAHSQVVERPRVGFPA